MQDMQTAAERASASGPSPAPLSPHLAGFSIPRIGLGCMALSIEGRPRRDTAVSTIHAALDAGVRYLDTAWSYYLPGGPEQEGERIVAQALCTWDGPRDEVLVATKTGYQRGFEVGDWQADSRPETMIRNAKESARALGVETISLLYSHCPDPRVPYEDEMGALRQLLDEGVIRYAGISRVTNRQIDVARSILGDRLAAVQNQFSPVHRDEEGTLQHCQELGLPFVCWSPLGGYLETIDMSKLVTFRQVAGERGVSYQRVILAWELAHSPVLLVIPSAQNPHEIRDSYAALSLRLTADELKRLG